MDRWEYMFSFMGDPDPVVRVNEISKLGLAGWEMVGVLPYGDGERFYMKRRIDNG